MLSSFDVDNNNNNNNNNNIQQQQKLPRKVNEFTIDYCVVHPPSNHPRRHASIMHGRCADATLTADSWASERWRGKGKQ